MADSNVTLKEFVKSSAILTVANVILKAMNFFLLPLYTKYLAPADIGISDSVTNLMSFIYPILVLGFDSAFSAFYFAKEDPARCHKVYRIVRRVTFVSSAFMILILILSGRISYWLFGTDAYRIAVIIAAFTVVFELWTLSDALDVRLENRMTIYGLITVVTSAVMLGSNILLVAVLKQGYISLIVSACLANFVRMVMFRAAAGRKERTLFDRELFREMIRYALPMVPMVVVGWVLTFSDRYILLYFWDESVVGLYGIAQRFANVLNIVVSSVAIAFTTFAFSNVEGDGAKEKYRMVLNYVFITLQIMVIFIATFARPIIEIMTKPAYHEAYVLVQPLMYGQLLYCISTIIRYGFAYTKKSYLNLIPTGAAAILNVVLNFILVPKYGAYAATLTTLVSYLVMTVLVEILSNKVYPCKYDIGKIFIVMAVGYVLSYVTRDMNYIVQIASFLVQAAAMFAIFRNEINAVLKIASSVLRKRIGNR